MRSTGALAIAALAVLAGLPGCSAEPEPEPSEELDIVARKHPVITSVTTDDGFTQVRQSSTATLVIKGKKLGHTTSVSVGDFLVNSIDSVRPHEVRVSVFTFGGIPLGPADVTVTSTDGTAVAPGAIELTPFVISPTAVGGHGTFQSPMSLCDPDLAGFPDSTSTALLLAGTHRCGQLVIVSAGLIAGDPDHLTVVTGTDDGGVVLVAGALGGPVTIRDLTFAQPLSDRSIDFSGGELTVERVIDFGGGIAAGENDTVKIDHYTYEGEGDAVDISSGVITSSSIRHCGSGRGIVARGGSNGGGVTIDHTVIEDCGIGIEFAGPGGFGRVGGEVTHSELLDNGIGISARFANLSVQGTVIRGNDATPRVSSIGLSLGSGFTSLSDIEITGQQDFGVGISHQSSDGQDAVVFASGLDITGGKLGVSISGIDNNLFIDGSIIRDQTVASVEVGSLDGSISIGGNQLSVLSGFAISDSRFTESGLSHFIHAEGTTLNGVSFDGQSIEGPTELAPYYHIAFDSGIQF
jgi:hypothetical protein